MSENFKDKVDRLIKAIPLLAKKSKGKCQLLHNSIIITEQLKELQKLYVVNIKLKHSKYKLLNNYNFTDIIFTLMSGINEYINNGYIVIICLRGGIRYRFDNRDIIGYQYYVTRTIQLDDLFLKWKEISKIEIYCINKEK